MGSCLPHAERDEKISLQNGTIVDMCPEDFALSVYSNIKAEIIGSRPRAFWIWRMGLFSMYCFTGG